MKLLSRCESLQEVAEEGCVSNSSSTGHGNGNGNGNGCGTAAAERSLISAQPSEGTSTLPYYKHKPEILALRRGQSR